MKSVIFILLMTVAFAASAQVPKKELSMPETEQFVKQHDIDYLRSCLEKYHRERRTGYLATGVGIGLTAFGAATMNESGQSIFFLIGGALGLYGTYTFIHAERHLKSASIKPMEGAAGVTLSLKL